MDSTYYQASLGQLRQELVSANEASAAECKDLKQWAALALLKAKEAYGKSLEQRLEAEKEKRVAHLQQQAARRIANRGIAMGFTTWQEQWEEAARQKRMLAAAAARLACPALAAAVAHWVGDWRLAERGRMVSEADAVRCSPLNTLRPPYLPRNPPHQPLTIPSPCTCHRTARTAVPPVTPYRLTAVAAWQVRAAMQEESGSLLTTNTQLTTDLAAAEAALAAAVATAQRERRELVATAADDSAAAQAAHQLQMQSLTEIEKEKRVAHLQQQAARRIANTGIAKGFTTWQGQWEEAARQKRMLAAAAGRLARPALAAAVVHWRNAWYAAGAERAEAAQRGDKARYMAVGEAARLHLDGEIVRQRIGALGLYRPCCLVPLPCHTQPLLYSYTLTTLYTRQLCNAIQCIHATAVYRVWAEASMHMHL